MSDKPMNRQAVAVFLAANVALYETVHKTSPKLTEDFLYKFQSVVEGLLAGEEYKTEISVIGMDRESAFDAAAILNRISDRSDKAKGQTNE